MATTDGIAFSTMEETSVWIAEVTGAPEVVLLPSSDGSTFTCAWVSVWPMVVYCPFRYSPVVFTANIVPPATVPNRTAAAVTPAIFPAMLRPLRFACSGF